MGNSMEIDENIQSSKKESPEVLHKVSDIMASSYGEGKKFLISSEIFC